MSDDMDINAGKIINGEETLEKVSEEIYTKIVEVVSGFPTVSEKLGHQEYAIAYKTFEPIGPSCLSG